jgi:ketosteroid isomerase-like protein
MSQENVEIVKGLFAAWNRRDYAASQEPIDPDIDVESTSKRTSTEPIAELRVSRNCFDLGGIRGLSV